MYFKVKYLKNVKIILGLGRGFTEKYLKNQVFLFTESINKNNGGYVKFPYGYNGYMIIEYDPASVRSLQDGQWDFELTFIRNSNNDLALGESLSIE